MFALPLSRTTRYRLFICLLLLAGLLVAGSGVLPAAAQQPDSSEADSMNRMDPPVRDISVDRKSSGRALLYSLGGTALLTPVAGVGLVIGPSFGHFYAENTGQGWTGIAIRTGSVGLVGVGSILALGGKKSGWNAMVLGVLGGGASAIYDIVTAPGAATDYNEAHNLSAQVAPTVGPRGEQAGLALRITF